MLQQFGLCFSPLSGKMSRSDRRGLALLDQITRCCPNRRDLRPPSAFGISPQRGKRKRPASPALRGQSFAKVSVGRDSLGSATDSYKQTPPTRGNRGERGIEAISARFPLRQALPLQDWLELHECRNKCEQTRDHARRGRSKSAESRMIVNGPSLTNSTCISAPKRPV